MRFDAQRPPMWSDIGVNFTVAGLVLQGLRVVQRSSGDVQAPLPSAMERELEKVGERWFGLEQANQIASRHGNPLPRRLR